MTSQDTDHVNPLIRALAIRTMGCIRVDKILDHLCEPLRKCLGDDNPYVRKTAAICVAKLWDLDQERAIENGFVTILQDLISDSTPMVRILHRGEEHDIGNKCNQLTWTTFWM